MCSIRTSDASRRGRGRCGARRAHVWRWGVAGRRPRARARAAARVAAPRTRRDSPGRAREVHDERRAAETRDPAGEERVRRPRERVGADRLGDAGRLAIDDGAVASGVTSRGANPVPPVVNTSNECAASSTIASAIASRSSGTTRRTTSKPSSRRRSSSASPLASSRSPAMDAVGHGEHRRAHSGSFVFSTSRTSPISMPCPGLRHVVDGERRDRRRDERLHLDAGLRSRLGRRLDLDPPLGDLEADVHMRERERMAEGDRARPCASRP